MKDKVCNFQSPIKETCRLESTRQISSNNTETIFRKKDAFRLNVTEVVYYNLKCMAEFFDREIFVCT